jgi:nucleoside-diphosphate-sugar epimerase
MSTRTTRRPRGGERRSRAALTVAVTGASGTLGPPLLRRLAAEDEVRRLVVLGRRQPELPGTGADVELRTVDVRDRAAVGRAIEGCDVVIHAAYALYGIASREADLFSTNVEGTLNVARAARVAGAKRFVYTSSSAVYGFHGDNPQPIDESAPIRASSRHFYSRQKAQAELLVREELEGSGTEAYLFRPCGIVGPHAVGGALAIVPDRVASAARSALGAIGRAGLRPLVPPPPVPFQFVHEDDVAQALVQAALGRGPAGVYNLAGEGVLDGPEAVRAMGMLPLPLPRGLTGAAVRAAASLPPLLPAFGWFEAGTAPMILDVSRARSKLGWSPGYTSKQALVDTRLALGW